MNPEFTSPMEVNVLVIAGKCRLCAVDTLDTSFDIFSTCGLQNKIRKYLQITIKSEDYLPKIVCGSCYETLEKFDHLCRVASGAQKELLMMLNDAQLLPVKDIKKANKRRKKDGPVNGDGDEKPKKRRRRKKKDEQLNHLIALPSTIITDFWGNFKLGQIIRDTELIKLILKALKWTETDENVERLRQTDLGVVLSNSDLLHDDDLIRLIKSYMGQDGNNNNNSMENAAENLMDTNYITEMEVVVDPSLFLDTEDMETDDSRTISVDLDAIAEEVERISKEDENSPNFECTSCPDRFQTHVQLQDHVLTHLIKRSQEAELAKSKKSRKKRGQDQLTISNGKEKENDPSKVCQYCQKQFKRRQDLKFHINQHTGERPFRCVSCPKAFASSGNCLTHRKRMHPELFPKKTN